jgi:hypothetical protein
LKAPKSVGPKRASPQGHSVISSIFSTGFIGDDSDIFYFKTGEYLSKICDKKYLKYLKHVKIRGINGSRKHSDCPEPYFYRRIIAISR